MLAGSIAASCAAYINRGTLKGQGDMGYSNNVRHKWSPKAAPVDTDSIQESLIPLLLSELYS